MLQAAFFDRDGTITFNDPEWTAFRRECFLEWSGQSPDESYEFFMRQFDKVKNGGFPFSDCKTLDEEILFFRQWFLYAFEESGIRENISERARILTDKLWFWKKQPYPDALRALNAFHSSGIRMGVISDTSPSLEHTLKMCGLHAYFDTFTCSALAGFMKPDPRIYQAALREMGVSPEECLYVDDTKEEADGARALGFTSYHLDRSGKENAPWTIHTLDELIPFAGNPALFPARCP